MPAQPDAKLKKILEQVPPDYYQTLNWLQKIWHLGKLRAVLDLIPADAKTILDVGCGSGWFLNEVSKRFPKTQLTGVDLYPDAITYGKKRYRKLDLQQADAHKLPFKSGSFDVVICTEVIEHLYDISVAIAEMKRVVKPGSTIIIEVDSGNLPFRIVFGIWEKFKGKVWHNAHMGHFSIDHLEKTIKSTGLTIRKVTHFNQGMAVAYKLTA